MKLDILNFSACHDIAQQPPIQFIYVLSSLSSILYRCNDT